MSYDAFITMKGGKRDRTLSKVVAIKALYRTTVMCALCVLSKYF